MDPTTWNEAARSVIAYYDDSHFNRRANLTLMDYCIDVLCDAVKHNEQPPSFAFGSLCIEAIAELRARSQWNPDEFARLLCSKQHDYGHDNINKFGLNGLVVRLSDKIARLKNLKKKALPRNEAVLDTWQDIVGYCVIAEMLMDGTFQYELESKND